MRIATLGSGSSGNSTLVQMGDSLILIDCGFGIKDTCSRLQQLGLTADALSAVLVTHEHYDHISGVEPLAARHGLPVYMTAGTSRRWKSRGRVQANIIQADQEFLINDVQVRPVAVPHDACEPVQFVLCHRDGKIGVLTDLGSLTPHVKEAFSGCQLLLVEANHDLQMLRDGPYPSSLKRRVAGDWGHLNNSQTVQLISELSQDQAIEHLIIGHISEKNNQPEKIAQELEACVMNVGKTWIASQDIPLDWVQI